MMIINTYIGLLHRIDGFWHCFFSLHMLLHGVSGCRWNPGDLVLDTRISWLSFAFSLSLTGATMVLLMEGDIALLCSTLSLTSLKPVHGQDWLESVQLITDTASTWNGIFLHLSLVFFPCFCSVSFCSCHWKILALYRVTPGLRSLCCVRFLKQMALTGLVEALSGEAFLPMGDRALAVVKAHGSPFLLGCSRLLSVGPLAPRFTLWLIPVR